MLTATSYAGSGLDAFFYASVGCAAKGGRGGGRYPCEIAVYCRYASPTLGHVPDAGFLQCKNCISTVSPSVR